MKVAVLGAGFAGLTVAHALKRDATHRGVDLSVEIFEAGARAGGRIRTTNAEGFLVEWAADAFQTGPGPAQTLIQDLGLTGERVDASPQAARRYVFSRGKLHRFPSGPGSLLHFSAISPKGRLRVLAEHLVARRVAHEESVQQFAARHVGEEAARAVAGSFVRGVYAGDAAKLSLDASFPKLRELEKKHRSLLLAMGKGGSGAARNRSGPKSQQGTRARWWSAWRNRWAPRSTSRCPRFGWAARPSTPPRRPSRSGSRAASRGASTRSSWRLQRPMPRRSCVGSTSKPPTRSRTFRTPASPSWRSPSATRPSARSPTAMDSWSRPENRFPRWACSSNPISSPDARPRGSRSCAPSSAAWTARS